jgi:hypothetical protein
MDSFMDEWLWEPAGGAFSVTYPAKTTLFAGRQFRRCAKSAEIACDFRQ